MRLVVLGMSHKTAPVELRERFAVPGEAMAPLLHRLTSLDGVREAMAVSTCNRVEIYAVHDGERPPMQVLRHALCAERGLDTAALDDHGYTHAGRDAVLHLLRVSASLDSMVVGEPQILGQVKEAAESARAAGTVGPLLGRLLDRAYANAKAVRTGTGIGRSVVSVASVAVDLARRIFDDLSDVRVLIVGAGKMAEATARALDAAGAGRVYVANRSIERAQALAEAHGWRARSLAELEDLLAQSDVVVTSTGAARPIIDVALMRRVVKARKYRPIFLVDIAVPRDVEGVVGELDNVYLYNVDDLQGISRENLEERQRAAEEAEALTRRAVDEIDAWYRGLEVKPTLAAIRRRADEVARAELERTLGKRLAHLAEEDRQALDKMVQAMVSKLLHPAMAALRSQADAPGARDLVAAARTLYGIEDDAAGDGREEEA